MAQQGDYAPDWMEPVEADAYSRVGHLLAQNNFRELEASDLLLVAWYLPNTWEARFYSPLLVKGQHSYMFEVPVWRKDEGR